MAQKDFIPWIIKTFRGGTSDESDKGISGSFKFGYGGDIHKNKDSYSCQQALQRITSGDEVTDLPLWFVPCSIDGTTYAFGDGGTIYTRAGSGGEFIARYHDTNGKIKGAKEWTFNDGNTYLVWATDTSVSRKQIITGSSGQNWANVTIDWFKLLTSADWHTMENACGNLMIANSLYLAMITYTTVGVIMTPDALNLRPGNLAKCLEERDDYVIIGSTHKDNDELGHLWSWITTAQNYVQKKKIPAMGVNSLIYTELPFLQAGTNGQLFYSDFTNVVPVHQIPGGGYSNPGGVCEDENLALFAIYGGLSTTIGVWSYGRKLKNRPQVLNYEYRISQSIAGSAVTQIGAIANINGELLASWKTMEGTAGELHYGVDCISSTTKATALYETLEFSGGVPHNKKYFQTAKVVMEPLPTGCSIALKYKADRGSWITALTGDGQTSFNISNSTEAMFIINQKAKIIEIGLTLTPSGNTTPEILDVITYISANPDEY